MSVSHLMNLIGLINTFEGVYFFLGPVLALLVATMKLDSNAWDWGKASHVTQGCVPVIVDTATKYAFYVFF